MLQAGATHAAVAEAMGVNVRTVAKWSARFRVFGWESLRQRRRGRRLGEQEALSEDQQAEVIVVLTGKNPDQLQLPGVLWDRAAVRALIIKLFGIELTRQTVGVYLRKWGFSGKKPERRWAKAGPRAHQGVARGRVPEDQGTRPQRGSVAAVRR